MFKIFIKTAMLSCGSIAVFINILYILRIE